MNRTVILTLDTTKREETSVTLSVDGRDIGRTHRGAVKSQVVLPLIEELISAEGIVLSDITEIIVNTGPGSFTGIRVGLSVANTLSVLYGIPVNGKRELAKAQY